MPIPVDSGCIPVESGLIPVDSSGFQWNPVIPAGMVGGVTSTVGTDQIPISSDQIWWGV